MGCEKSHVSITSITELRASVAYEISLLQRWTSKCERNQRKGGKDGLNEEHGERGDVAQKSGSYFDGEAKLALSVGLWDKKE